MGGRPAEPQLVIVDPETGRTESVGVGSLVDIAAGGRFGWVVAKDVEFASSGGSLDRVDPRTRAVAHFQLEDDPSAVAYGAGAVWVLFASEVKRFDPRGRRTGSVDLSGLGYDAGTGDIAVSAEAVWVTASGEKRVLRIDPKTAKLDGDPVAIPVRDPLEVAAVGDSAWIAVKDEPPLQLGPG